MRARITPAPNTACATCGGPTLDGRPIQAAVASSWRLCATCGPLRTSDATAVAAVRARHGDQAAAALQALGVRAACQAAGVTLQSFAVHASSPRDGSFAPGEPWEHEAAQVDRLAAYVAAQTAARQAAEEDARARLRPWPAHCLSCPAELRPQAGRTAPLCDECATAWQQTHNSLYGAAA